MSSGQVPLPPPLFGLMQRWENLLFMHWPVAPERIRPLVPDALDIDTFDGLAYVSLTPFRLSGMREAFLPAIPGLSSFLELNTRTYVHRNGAERGVWFLSLDASQTLAVLGARLAYALPYFSAEMEMEESDGWFHFRSHRVSEPPGRGSFRVAYQPAEPLPYEPGSLPFFLTERYELYSASEDWQTLYRARVHHAPGELYAARIADFETDLLELAGTWPVEGGPILHYWPLKEVQADHPEMVGP